MPADTDSPPLPENPDAVSVLRAGRITEMDDEGNIRHFIPGDGSRPREMVYIRLWHGTQKWYRNGLLHWDDGPAVVFLGGDRDWYCNGKRHREDGPAVLYSNGFGEWWVHGIHYENEGEARIAILKAEGVAS